MQRFNKSKGSSSRSSRRGCQSGADPLDDTLRAGRQSSLNATIVQRCSHSNNGNKLPALSSPALSSSSLCDDTDDAARAATTSTTTAVDHAALQEANAKNLQIIEDAVTTLAGMKRFERASRLAGTGEEESNTRPDTDGSTSAISGTMLRNSVSMIELRELADIRAFDEVMQAIAYASSPSDTPAATATTNINHVNIANDDASANVIVSNEENNDNDDDDDGGFFIGDTEDGEISDFNTSYIIEEQKIHLNDVADGDDEHHHHVFSPLKRMHSLPADPNSSSGCSTTTRRTSFLPSCASIC